MLLIINKFALFFTRSHPPSLTVYKHLTVYMRESLKNAVSIRVDFNVDGYIL